MPATIRVVLSSSHERISEAEQVGRSSGGVRTQQIATHQPVEEQGVRQGDPCALPSAPEPYGDDSGGDARAPRDIRSLWNDEMDARVSEEAQRQRQTEYSRRRDCAEGVRFLEERRVVQIVCAGNTTSNSGCRLMQRCLFRRHGVDSDPAKGSFQARILESAPAHTERASIRHGEALPPELGRQLLPKARKPIWCDHTVTVGG